MACAKDREAQPRHAPMATADARRTHQERWGDPHFRKSENHLNILVPKHFLCFFNWTVQPILPNPGLVGEIQVISKELDFSANPSSSTSVSHFGRRLMSSDGTTVRLSRRQIGPHHCKILQIWFCNMIYIWFIWWNQKISNHVRWAWPKDIKTYKKNGNPQLSYFLIVHWIVSEILWVYVQELDHLVTQCFPIQLLCHFFAQRFRALFEGQVLPPFHLSNWNAPQIGVGTPWDAPEPATVASLRLSRWKMASESNPNSLSTVSSTVHMYYTQDWTAWTAAFSVCENQGRISSTYRFVGGSGDWNQRQKCIFSCIFLHICHVSGWVGWDMTLFTWRSSLFLPRFLGFGGLITFLGPCTHAMLSLTFTCTTGLTSQMCLARDVLR